MRGKNIELKRIALNKLLQTLDKMVKNRKKKDRQYTMKALYISH